MAQNQVTHPGPENNYRRQSTTDFMFSVMPVAAGLFSAPTPVAAPAPEVSPMMAMIAALRETPEYAHSGASHLICLINANPAATVEELVAMRRAQ